MSVDLSHDDSNLGANQLVVRARDVLDRELTETIDVHFAVGSVFRLNTTLDGAFIDIELLDVDAPLTVANFASLADEFANTVIHRSVPFNSQTPAVIQGGGFLIDDGQAVLQQSDTVDNEFLPQNSNVRGTLAMALSLIHISEPTRPY